MKLDEARTRDQLQQLTDKELLRNLLANTPLNLPRVFVYALYFIFMPAAILGPVLGVIGTALLAGVAAYLWLWGEPGSMDAFLWFWLIWAVVDWVLLILFRLVMGIWEYRQFRKYLLPDDDACAPDLHPGQSRIWDFEQGENQKKSLVVQVQKQGIYVLSAKVQDADSRVDVTFDACACMTERELVPGLVNAAAAAYRLEPGCHRLAVHVQSRTASRVSVSLR